MLNKLRSTCSRKRGRRFTWAAIRIVTVASFLGVLWWALRGPVDAPPSLGHSFIQPQQNYDPQCKWTYDEATGGYPPVANDGRRDLANYVCPSMFRDMSDYVYSWPYAHFSEHDVWVADPLLASQNLPPVSISRRLSRFLCWISCLEILRLAYTRYT